MITLGGFVVISLALGAWAGFHVGVRIRAREVERVAMALHSASLEAQAAAVEQAAARLVIEERRRYDEQIRGMIAEVAPLVQADLERAAYGGRAVAIQRALYDAQNDSPAAAARHP